MITSAAYSTKKYPNYYPKTYLWSFRFFSWIGNCIKSYICKKNNCCSCENCLVTIWSKWSPVWNIDFESTDYDNNDDNDYLHHHDYMSILYIVLDFNPYRLTGREGKGNLWGYLETFSEPTTIKKTNKQYNKQHKTWIEKKNCSPRKLVWLRRPTNNIISII